MSLPTNNRVGFEQVLNANGRVVGWIARIKCPHCGVLHEVREATRNFASKRLKAVMAECAESVGKKDPQGGFISC